jgi:predicted small lipoprotein YifL
MRSALLLLVLLTSLLSAGCALVGTLNLPQEVVTVPADRTQVVTINSEPPGARIVNDGLEVGTTPTRVELAYEQRTATPRLRHCWLIVPAGLVDLAVGGAVVWASHRWLYNSGHRDDGFVGMFLGTVWGLGNLAGALLVVADGCAMDRKPHPFDHPRDHRLRLVKDGWEEPINVRVPTSDAPKKILVVIRSLEERDWLRTESSNTTEDYAKYLADYPSGRWRKEAKAGQEERSAWQSARRLNSVSAYTEYCHSYPRTESCLTDAQSRIDDLLWQEAQAKQTIDAYRVYLEFAHMEERRVEAAARIDDLAWQDAQAKKTLVAYKRYLELAPSGKRRAEAKGRVDDLAWQDAEAHGTTAGYREYLALCSWGRRRSTAQRRLEELTWKETQEENTAAAYGRYLDEFPSGKWRSTAQGRCNALALKEAQPRFEGLDLAHALTTTGTVAEA